MESCLEQIICTGITHPFPDSRLLPRVLTILKGLNLFFLNQHQIISDKYVFSLKKGLRVTFNTARIITYEELLIIAKNFLQADSLELRLRVFLKDPVFSLGRIYRLNARTVRNRDYFLPQKPWLGWMMILVFSSTFLEGMAGTVDAKEGATSRQCYNFAVQARTPLGHKN